MKDPTRSEVTRLLDTLATGEAGHGDATSRIFETLYHELRQLAASVLCGERPNHTLQPTALVHEAYARLVAGQEVTWRSRAHVMRIAGRAMRRVLTDYARRRAAEKRGSNPHRVTLANVHGIGARELELVELDDALGKLAGESQRAADVAELKVFAGLTGDEIAAALGISRRTVSDDWAMARMWLAREMAA